MQFPNNIWDLTTQQLLLMIVADLSVIVGIYLLKCFGDIIAFILVRIIKVRKSWRSNDEKIEK